MFRVSTVRGKKSGKWRKKSRSGDFMFSLEKLGKKMKKKKHEKVMEFQNFPKKLLVSRLLKIFIFHKLQAILEKGCF